jgi:hypothetical protein
MPRLWHLRQHVQQQEAQVLHRDLKVSLHSPQSGGKARKRPSVVISGRTRSNSPRTNTYELTELDLIIRHVWVALPTAAMPVMLVFVAKTTVPDGHETLSPRFPWLETLIYSPLAGLREAPGENQISWRVCTSERNGDEYIRGYSIERSVINVERIDFAHTVQPPSTVYLGISALTRLCCHRR